VLDTLCAADDALGLGLRIAAVSRDPQRFLARFPAFAGDPRIDWIKRDLRELEWRRDAVSHVIHAAADTTAARDPASQSELYDSIVEGTRRALAIAGAGCRGVLFLSSGAVYGAAQPGHERFRETDSPAARPAGAGGTEPGARGPDAYADGKRAAEALCSLAAGAGMPVKIARCFAFVGPHMPFDKHFAIGNFIADAASGTPIRVKSDGRALLAVLVDGAGGRAYNVGSDVPVSIAELAHCVDQVVGGAGVRVEGAPSAPGDRYVPDTTRLREELGWRAHIPLDAAIARTAAWYRAGPGRRVPS
jgi:dTDP-glucose 4,6-dehydratase